MKTFLKDNIALVAAIVLPALLAVFFLLSTLFVNISVPDPKHDFLIATDYYHENSSFQLNVNNDKLTILWQPPLKDAQGNITRYNNAPRLWRVHVPNMAVQEISLNKPANEQAQEIAIPGITDLKIQNLTPGPDGYAFTNSYSYGSNLMTEIFAGGHRESSAGIYKDGRNIEVKIPSTNGYYYSSYNTNFIGWIIAD